MYDESPQQDAVDDVTGMMNSGGLEYTDWVRLHPHTLKQDRSRSLSLSRPGRTRRSRSTTAEGTGPSLSLSLSFCVLFGSGLDQRVWCPWLRTTTTLVRVWARPGENWRTLRRGRIRWEYH